MRATDLGGVPLDGVLLSLDGIPLGETDAAGALDVDVADGDEALLRAMHVGFIGVTRFVRPHAGATLAVPLVLAPMAAPIAIADVSLGLHATGDRGAILEAPAAAFVDASGAPATGAADVFLTYFDPANAGELSAYPGDLRAEQLDGQLVVLETWGVIDATVRQGSEELQVAAGATVRLSFPMPSFDAAPPATIAVWTHDADAGLWREEAQAATWDAASSTFVAELTHLSPKNIDQAAIPTCVRGRVKDAEGRGISGATIKARTITDAESSDGWVAQTWTDWDGTFCIYAERNADVLLRVYTPLDLGCPGAMNDGEHCITERRIHTGGQAVVNVEWPEQCDLDCTVVWPSITAGAPDPGPLTPACEPSDAPLHRVSCAADLTRLFECFDAHGTCTQDLNPFGPFGPEYEMTWETGARIVFEFDPLIGPVQKFYGPTGELCGMMQATGSETVFIIDGERIELSFDESGSMSLDCGDGFEYRLTIEESDFFDGCAMQSSAEAGECDPRPGSFNAPCDLGGCDEMLECCGSSGARKCMTPDLCDAVCATDADCPIGPLPLYCCSVGFFDACLPQTSCI